MVVKGQDNDDPVGIQKKPATMPKATELAKILKGFDGKEEKEEQHRCPCPYFLKDRTIFVDKHLGETVEKC